MTSRPSGGRFALPLRRPRPSIKKRKRGEAAEQARTLPARLDMMEQSEAKAYMPPGAFLWKSRRDSCWHSKVAKFSTCNRSMHRHGDGALRVCISDAWHKCCLLEGIAVSEALVDGLLSEGEVAETS